MAGSRPTLDQWRALFDAADRVKELAPWEWMTEGEVFGVHDPVGGEIGFLSVMGMQGEHFGISLYRGLEGLGGFAAIQTADLEAYPEMLFEVPQLQASFEDRETLRKEDREVIRRLGRGYRGRNAWPQFRSFRPGFVPWSLEADEARILAQALEQLLAVAPRLREDPNLLQPRDAEHLFVRVREAGSEGVWADRMVKLEDRKPKQISVCWDDELLEELARAPRGEVPLEVDLFLLPAAIHEKGKRPVFPYVLLAVDGGSGLILGADTLQVEESVEAMWGSVPERLMRILRQTATLPAQVRVRSELLATVLEPVADRLEVPLTKHAALEQLDRARSSLLERLG